jgi:hypothetical protein
LSLRQRALSISPSEREEVRNVRKSTLIRLLVVLATVGGTLASGFGRGELVWPP